MKLNLPEPTYYTFNQLSIRWRVDEGVIENYLTTDVIKKCEIVPSLNKVSTKDKNRILRLMSILNIYACDKIKHELENNKYISKHDGFVLSEAYYSDYAFKCWIQYKEYYLDKIFIVIPIDEVKRFEAEYQNSKSETKKNYLLKTIVQDSAKKLYESTGKWPEHTEALSYINDEAGKDGEVGRIVKYCSVKEGIILVNGEKISTKTMQNWLSRFKKQFPELVRR